MLRKIKGLSTVLVSKILPFSIWALLYPYKSNYGYIYDQHGNRLVQHIGRTKYLGHDLWHNLKQLDISVDELKVGRNNISDHKTYNKYYQNRLFRIFMKIKLKKDIELYDSVQQDWKQIE